MKDRSLKNQVFAPLKNSIRFAKNSFENFSEEMTNKWRIGRRNLP